MRYVRRARTVGRSCTRVDGTFRRVDGRQGAEAAAGNPGERAVAETRTILICIFSGRSGNSARKHVKVLYNTSAMKAANFYE